MNSNPSPPSSSWRTWLGIVMAALVILPGGLLLSLLLRPALAQPTPATAVVTEPNAQAAVDTASAAADRQSGGALAVQSAGASFDSPLPKPLVQPKSPLAKPLTSSAPLAYTYRIRNVYPRDPGAFTQGLIYHNGYLYEGTGLEGRSSLRQVALETGEVLRKIDLEPQLFGEGIVLVGKQIVQLTWRNQVGFVWDADQFTVQKQFTYGVEGWGITHDGDKLIMSDGSDTLYFWDTALLTDTNSTASVIGQLQVRNNDQPVFALNELEFVEDEIFANIWQTDQVARIDPQSGLVTGWINLAGLLTPEERSQSDVLNGIAYDPDQQRLFVTGKLWPKLFEIEVVTN